MTEPTQTSRYVARLDAARAALAHFDVGALVISSPVNVRYLTGFTGSNASVLLTETDSILVTDGRYIDQARTEASDLVVLRARETDSEAVSEAVRLGAARIALEAEHVSWADHDALSAATASRLIPTRGVVEKLRRHKDPDELQLIAEACRIICAALERLLVQIRPGLTERAVARRLAEYMLDLGADDVAFETIVAGGPNTAIPHHTPTDRPLGVGDLLKIDAGALFHGYHSDVTRTFVVGADPTPEQRRLHTAVAEAAAAARAVVAPGVPVAAADGAAREVLRAAGLEDNYTHGLGHGVGLQIHEAPMLGHRMTDTIAQGDVLTIEPGAYVPGFGGVRVEDTLAISADGSECLTPLARELIRLG